MILTISEYGVKVVSGTSIPSAEIAGFVGISSTNTSLTTLNRISSSNRKSWLLLNKVNKITI